MTKPITITNRSLRMLSGLSLGVALLAGCSAVDDDDMNDFGPGFGPLAPGDDDEAEDDGEEDDGDEPGGEPEPVPEDHSEALDDYILSLPHLAIEPLAAKHAIVCDPATMDCPAPWSEGEQTCQMQYYSLTEHEDRFLALQPDDPLLWPGSIVRGNEVEDGFLSAIGLPRAPATFSVSLENIQAAPAAMMDAPSLSSFRTARNAILAAGVTGATPAQMSYEIYSVNSRSHLSVIIGAKVDWASAVDLDAMFNFDDGEYQNRYLFDFTQTYYTIDLDTPPWPSSFFAPEVTVEDLEAFTSEESPPMYVQSVVYGRRVLFAIESNESLAKIIAAVDAAFGGAAMLELDVDSSETLASAKITAGIIGGNGEAAVQSVLGADHLIEFITSGGNYSADSPGGAIAYRLAYLDNTTARLALTAQYPEKVCQ
jgi:thiol-activated cytolysin